MKILISNSEKQTLDLGKRLATFLQPKDIICLFGGLGAGKTIFVKGMAIGLGIDKDDVISPSFVLIREYLSKDKIRKKIPLYHFDLYRLNSPNGVFNLGYEEYFYDKGICVIEWAQRLKRFLPEEYLKIEFFRIGKNKRKIKLIAKGKRYQHFLTLDK